MIGHVWFQNLNDNPRRKRLFHFRGSIGRSWEKLWFRYELCSGPACRLSAGVDDEGTNLSFGLGLFTIYLTIPKRIRPLRYGREYGFYIHDWVIRFFFGSKKFESSTKDPWYYNFTVDPLRLLFGKTEHFEKKLIKNHRPVQFSFRGKSYIMEKIHVNRSHWFRTRVPFALYCRKMLRMDLEISKPPMRAGKGENSWDCDDDGSFGMCAPYNGPEPSWKNMDEVFEWCCRYYCESAHKDMKRYGRASGDELPPDEFGFKYLGQPRPENNNNPTEMVSSNPD